MNVVYGWWTNFGTSLQALPHIRNVISIKHTVYTECCFLSFLLVLPIKERKNFIWFSEKHINVLNVLFLQIFNTKNCRISLKSQPRVYTKTFLKFGKFQL